MQNAERRMRVLESHETTKQRQTVSGLVHLLETGRLDIEQCTNEELERLVAGLPGEVVDLSHLSDQELAAIVRG